MVGGSPVICCLSNSTFTTWKYASRPGARIISCVTSWHHLSRADQSNDCATISRFLACSSVLVPNNNASWEMCFFVVKLRKRCNQAITHLSTPFYKHERGSFDIGSIVLLSFTKLRTNCSVINWAQYSPAWQSYPAFHWCRTVRP